MARRPRTQLPGAVYHVYSRGNRKGPIAEDDEDRQTFMRLLSHVHRRYEVKFYAACLMGTHYHAVMTTPRGNLSDAMKQLNGRFTQITNERHKRTGHLFEGRYSSIVIERDRYLRRVVRYLALNPVEAGLVKKPGDWPWSTYRATAGLDECPAWLTTDWMTWAFDVPTVAEAQSKFIKYVKRRRAGTFELDWNSVAYGTPEFESALAKLAKRRRPERRLPRDVSVPEPPTLRVLFANVESKPQRDRLIEVAHVRHGYPLAQISMFLGQQRDFASKILRKLEKRFDIRLGGRDAVRGRT